MFNLETGEEMPDEIDHINNDKNDNSLKNLRRATLTENRRNVGKRIDNTSGHKNIYITEWGTFKVLISCGKDIKPYAKTLKTLEEAIAHRNIKKIEFHGEFANNGEL